MDFITIDNKDTIVFKIAQLLRSRSDTGIRKYGTTLDRTDLSVKQWIDHAIEESLDHALYLMKLKDELYTKVQEKVI